MSKYIQRKKTTRLFYGKFINKIVLVTPVAGIFRGNNIQYTRKTIEYIAQRADIFDRCFREIEFAIKLHDILKNEIEEFSIRVESDILSIYSNNDEFIKSIKNLSGNTVIEIHQPATDKIGQFLLNSPNTIIAPHYDFKFKVQLRSSNKEFYKWAANTPTKYKCSERSATVYVLDEKSLNLCKIFLGNNIRRIDKYILVSEI